MLDRPTPQTVPLVDQQGRPVSLAALRGKVVVLAPFLSLCQDECPLVTGAFISLQRDLSAAGLAHRVVFVEATVDPGRDTVARLAAYEKEFGADWDLWTGTPDAIAAFWKPFGVEYQIVPEAQPAKIDWYTGQPLTYDVEHTDGYILINPSGRERFVDASAPNQKGELNAKLRSLLNDGGLHELQNPEAPDWTTADALSSISWLLGTNIPTVGLLMGSRLRRTALAVPAALAGFALLLSACAGAGVTTLSSPPTTDASLTLTLQHSPVGPILATGNGDTLYDFVPDTPTHSACLNDGCVFQWPPLVDTGAVRLGKGVDRSLVGTLQRPDGATQLSYGGHPLYTYNGDVAPGVVMGQALDQDGGLWYVLGADGKQIMTGFSVTPSSSNG